MCGILGFIAGRQSRFDPKNLRFLINRLLRLSETRGKEASGVVLSVGTRVDIFKRPVRATSLVRSKGYQALMHQIEKKLPGRRSEPLFAMGHTRMVTNGSADVHENNQPVFKHGMLCFHNGIVVNDHYLWKRFFRNERSLEVDTEVILSLIARYRDQGLHLMEAVRSAFNLLKGANSIALLAEDSDAVYLASTNGSLFAAASVSGAEFIYASEQFILKKALKHPAIKHLFAGALLFQVKPNTGYAITLDSPQALPFDLKDEQGRLPELPRREPARCIIDLRPDPSKKRRLPSRNVPVSIKHVLGAKALVAIDEQAIASLRRCARCLLPHTFPLIDFDENGICNYCRNFKLTAPKGETALIRCLHSSRRAKGETDCLVPLSGGRDSSYALHFVARVLEMKPVAYTYDWGMVTDLARRNISRMCGELGIEHILVSADIRKKRENIRKNVTAWLRNPNVGTVPLFMAGDKQFFYYANLLEKQMDISATLFSMNPLERTDFKSAFCGVHATNKKKLHWDLSGLNKFRLLLYYSLAFARNPAFLNSSLADSFRAYLSYYFLPKKFVLLYEYIPWDEAAIDDTLTLEYDWEKATDRNSTWRIGDGTAAFYNYIYYRVAGFTENDTFRSNQIRAGQITREDALARVHDDNRPRFEAIRWYCDTVGIDWGAAIQRINTIPPLYRN